jgi:HPt (histidine-containing phosphotransfer) domain-containing protein
MLGASGLQQLAEEMERLARQNDADALRARFEPLEAAVARADGLLREARVRRGV